MFFTKLKKKIMIDNVVKTNVIGKYGNIIDGDFYGLDIADFEGVSQSQVSEFMGIIPESWRSQFYVNMMSVNEYIRPHTDVTSYEHRKTAVNLYVEPASCVTTFHEPKPGAIMKKLDTLTVPTLYEWEDTNVIDSFKAERGDIYILDVTQYHSVTKPEEGKIRTMLTMTTSLDYNFVVDLLNGV